MKEDIFIKNFSKLPYSKQQELLEQLKFTLSESKPILQHKTLNKECIYCKSIKVYKHGFYKNGGTRYRCQDCKKSYNELTGTSIHAIKKKELWDRFIGLMLESKTIREIAEELKLSTKTVFDWRHKILSSFENTYTKQFKGIVETDEVFFPFNQKGRKKGKKKIYGAKQGASEHKVSIMFTLDRYKTYDFKLVKLGAINSTSLKRVMSMDKFNSQNIICSDSSTAIEKFIKEETQLVHKQIVASKKQYVVEGVYHVNTLNHTVNNFKSWVRGNFINVSTKYMKNYLNWFTMIEILKGKQKKGDKFWDYMLVDNETFDRSKSIETNYNKFLKIAD